MAVALRRLFGRLAGAVCRVAESWCTVFDYNNADFFSSLFLFTFALLMLTVVAAFARDAGVEEA